MKTESVGAIIEKVQALYRNGKLDEAIELLYEARTKYKENDEIARILSSILSDRGVARFSKLGQTELGFYDLVKATEINPTNYKAFVNLSTIAREREFLELALESAQKAVDIHPELLSDTQFVAHFNSLKTQGNKQIDTSDEVFAKPISTITRVFLSIQAGIATMIIVAVIVGSFDFIAFVAGMIVILIMDRWIKSPIRKRVKVGELIKSRMRKQLEAGGWIEPPVQETREDIQRLLAKEPKPAKLLKLLKFSPSVKERLKKANSPLNVSTMESVTPELFDPNEYSTFEISWAEEVIKITLEGETKARSCNFAEAISLFRKVLQMAPGHDISLLKLGVCFSVMGQDSTALMILERAKELYPTNHKIAQNLQAVRLRKPEALKSQVSCIQCGKQVLNTQQFFDLVEKEGFTVEQDTGKITNRIAGDFQAAEPLKLQRQQLLTSLENERGFQCVDCKKVFCPSCLSSAPTHPISGGRACPKCGGRFQNLN